MKIGVVGNGSMGRRRIHHSQHAGYKDITGFDLRADRRLDVEQKFKIKTVPTLQEFESQPFDAIFICTPPAEHLYYMNMAAEKGWHFMVENPVYHITKGLDELFNRIEQKGIVANVSCNLRFSKCIKRIKQLVKEEKVGKILSGVIEAGEYLPDWHPWEPYTDYYPSKREMGGGIDAICDLDWMVDIFGEIDNMNCVYSKKTDLDINTYDIVQFILEFKSGPQIILHTDMIQSPYDRYTKIIGEKGVIVWDYKKQIVRYYSRDTEKWEEFHDAPTEVGYVGKQINSWVEEMYFEDANHFFKCIKKEAVPLNSTRGNAKLIGQLLKALNYE